MQANDMRVNHKSALLRDQVLETLRTAIIRGRYPPGTRLIERELCEALGVSRTSVREVLRQLEAERLVAIEPRRGPIVATIAADEAREIYEVRALLEGAVVRRFIEQAKDSDYAVLRKHFTRFKTAAGSGDMEAMIAAMSEFYDVLFRGARNSVMHEMSRQLLARISFLRATSMSEKGRSKFSVVEIGNIVDAIERRDPDAAAAATVTHVKSAANAALRQLTAPKDNGAGQG